MTSIAKASFISADAENARIGAKPIRAAAPHAADPSIRRTAFSDMSSNPATVRPSGLSVLSSNVARPIARATAMPVVSSTVSAVAVEMPSCSGRMDLEACVPRSGVVDIDAADKNPAACSEYANTIYAHHRSEELTKSARHGYMALQSDINEKMRAILIDWLIEVHLKFKLMPETMYLTVNIIDRFLERKLVVRQKLQLVGVTAMLLASKYEEIYAPEVRDFVYVTDKAYTREQILAMESAILSALDFRITVPTAFVFLNRCLKAASADERTSWLATYFVERTMQEYKMLSHLPSKVAAAAVNMAVRTLRGERDAWNATLTHFSGYSQEELRGTITDMQDILATGTSSSLQAVRKKYQHTRFGEVANIPVMPLE